MEPQTRIFGTPWDAPVCEDAEVVPTPVGEKCIHCEEAVRAGETGLIQNCLGVEGWSARPAHKECFFRSTVGGIGHQLKMCSCYVDAAKHWEDPPGMTRRQAARVAWAFFVAMQRMDAN